MLKWVKKQFEGDDIEDVNSAVIDKIIKGDLGHKGVFGSHTVAAVLFCKLKKLNIYPKKQQNDILFIGFHMDMDVLIVDRVKSNSRKFLQTSNLMLFLARF